MRLKKSLALVALSVVCPLATLNAAVYKPFELNGFYYSADFETKTAYVTYPSNSNKSYYKGTVNIPSSITYEGVEYTINAIGHDAFSGQGELTTVIIPKTVETIGYSAFKGASSLSSVAFSSTGNLTTIEYEAFQNCKKLTNLKFPASLKTIEHHAFEYCEGLKTIDWGSVEILEKAAFKGCDNLVDLILPNSVLSIGEMCFWECSALRSAMLGSSIEYIGPDAFLDCHQLETVNIPESVTEIGYEAFRGCWNLTTMEIPNSVTKMGYSVFRYCTSLKEVKLGESLPEIPSWTFEQTSIETITIPNSVKTIGVGAFVECLNLKEIEFGTGLEEIWQGAFEDCKSLTSVTLPEPLTEIGTAAFINCENLNFVSIPRTVYNISERAFVGCSSLANINDLATVPQDIYGRNVFLNAGINNVVNVHVYEGLYDTYMSTLGWYDIGNEYLSHVKIIADIPVVAIESIEFVESPIHCEIGVPTKAEIKILPENAISTELSWSTSDDSILYVNMYTGEFIGLEDGEATLTVSVNDGSGVSATVLVIVGTGGGSEDENPAIESIEFVESSINCKIGVPTKAEIKISPENATDFTLVWSSSDESILSVDKYTGEFTGLKTGQATLTVSVEENNEISASILVVVSEVSGVQTITIDENNVIYNIYGQRLNHLQKGINIVNGKKVVVK